LDLDSSSVEILMSGIFDFSLSLSFDKLSILGIDSRLKDLSSNTYFFSS
jgi:hypothetical protein